MKKDYEDGDDDDDDWLLIITDSNEHGVGGGGGDNDDDNYKGDQVIDKAEKGFDHPRHQKSRFSLM